MVTDLYHRIGDFCMYGNGMAGEVHIRQAFEHERLTGLDSAASPKQMIAPVANIVEAPDKMMVVPDFRSRIIQIGIGKKGAVSLSRRSACNT